MENLWPNENHLAYGALRSSPPAWLPAAHVDRWERLRQLRMLFEGRHRCYFLDEGRTQFNYPEQEIQDRMIRPYHTFNLLKLVSVKTADLLFGAKARLTAPTRQQTDRLDELARRSLIHSRLHAGTVHSSWAGGGFMEAVLWRGEPFVQLVEPDEIYPLGSLMPDGQYERYIRYATHTVGEGETAYTLLLTTEYRPGSIVRTLHRLSREGKTESTLPLADWPPFSKDAPPPEQKTGLPTNTITYLPNEVGGAIERSDYEGLFGNQDTINAKIMQMARVIAQHADPKLAAPAASADPDGDVRSAKNLYYFSNKDEIPQYIVWTAELDAADRDIRRAIDAFCIASEMSQVLLGIKEGAAPDSARKVRLEATNSLAKVGRKALLIEPAIARAIENAQRMDQTTPLRRTYPVDAIGVELRDGLPVDELDEATTIATLRGANAMSLEAAVERRIGDPDAAAEEVARIRQEQAAAVPSTLMGEPAADPIDEELQQEAA